MFRKLSSLAALLVFTASAANATTIVYDDWNYSNPNAEVDWTVTVDDTSNADFYTFSVDINNMDLTGDIIGFGFNTDIDYGSDYLDLIADYDSVGFGTCAFLCNWNGTAAENPDYTFSVGRQGADYITSFSFGLPYFGQALEADTFSLVAIRARAIGDDHAFAKDYASAGSVVAVPELNGSVFGLCAAFVLTVLGLSGRKKAA